MQEREKKREGEEIGRYNQLCMEARGTEGLHEREKKEGRKREEKAA